MLAPSFSAVYVAVSILFGPCWATIYAGTLDTVDNEHTEMAGAVIVMAIVGAAVVPAIQGYVADTFHSLQLSFLVSMLSILINTISRLRDPARHRKSVSSFFDCPFCAF